MSTGRGVLAALRRTPRTTNAEPPELHYAIDEVLHFRDRLIVKGWAFSPEVRLAAIAWSLGPDQPMREDGHWRLPSPDVSEVYGPAAVDCRFVIEAAPVSAEDAYGFTLTLRFADGRVHRMERLVDDALSRDPYHLLQQRFFTELRSRDSARVLEIGARARSGNVRREYLGDRVDYVGVDIVDGPNVDVVADAHDLSRSFRPDSFDAVFSISTFEHLAMPWKAVLEINAILRTGGTVMVATHQSWPLHETPWDFWRFSTYTWPVLFNAATGFEVLESAMGEPASVVPHFVHPPTAGLDTHAAMLGTACLARKTGSTRLRWDVTPVDDMGVYPG